MSVKLLIAKILSFVPTRLPVGSAEFEVWAESIRSMVGPGFDKVGKDDILFVLATNVTHLGPQAAFKAKRYFVLTLRAAAAKQVAAGVFQGVKERQKAAQEVIAQQKLAEATALIDVANEQPKK